MSLFLEFKDTEGNCQRIELHDGTKLKIGRGSTSDTRIADPAMSRIHCELQVDTATIRVRDLKSTSGTFVGRTRVETAEIAIGHSFQAGNTTFRITSDSPLDAPTQMQSTSRPRDQISDLAAALDEKGRVDRFRITRLVSRSTQSLVYKCADSETDQSVGVKVVLTDESREEDEARFMRAMKMLQELRDPYLVKLIRAGRKSNYCWVAMEWFEDGSLLNRIEKSGYNNRLDWRDAWQVTSCMAQSLHVLEKAQVVHRNIRPSCILHRSSDNSWVLSDLLVAKTQRDTGSRFVTQQIFLPNDLAYTAPERLLGRESNEHSLQADIYSLGAVLTEMLIGEPPYGRGTLKELLPRLKDPRIQVKRELQIGMNEHFVDLVNKLTEPEPTRRFPSALKLWQAVERVGLLAGFEA